MVLLKSLSIFSFFVPFFIYAQSQPFLFKGNVYVTSLGNLVPAVDKLDRYNNSLEALSFGKFKVYFESTKALDNFTPNSSIVKNIQAGQCFIYLVHKDKVLSYLRYNQKKDCNDAPLDEPVSCYRLKRDNKVSHTHQAYTNRNELEKDCIGYLLYKFSYINEAGEELNCTKKIDLLHKVQNALALYPDSQENSSLHNYRFITHSGTTLHIQKAPNESTYYSKTEDGIFFESEAALQRTEVTYVKEKGSFLTLGSDKCYKVYTLKAKEEKEVLKVNTDLKFCEQI